jgi:hypothetical protein
LELVAVEVKLSVPLVVPVALALKPMLTLML